MGRVQKILCVWKKASVQEKWGEVVDVVCVGKGFGTLIHSAAYYGVPGGLILEGYNA
jgi:hypothetical protein